MSNDSNGFAPASRRALEARRARRLVRDAAAEGGKPYELFKTRHLAGLSFCGLSPIPVSLPVRMTQHSLRDIDPWWRPEAVEKRYTDDELAEDRRVAGTTYLVRTEVREMVLLDGRRLKAIREIYFDKATRQQSKELFAEDQTGQRTPYNGVPLQLMTLDGLDRVNIQPDREIVVTEGYPASEALRSRQVDAVAIISGTFELPSERTLAPLLASREILLWPDNDSAGAHLMDGVANRLHRMGARAGQIKLVLWRDGPRKGDAYDFSGDALELSQLLAGAATWDPNIRFATNSIQGLSIGRVGRQLRLNDDLKPPTPPLLRDRSELPPASAPAVDGARVDNSRN